MGSGETTVSPTEVVYKCQWNPCYILYCMKYRKERENCVPAARQKQWQHPAGIKLAIDADLCRLPLRDLSAAASLEAALTLGWDQVTASSPHPSWGSLEWWRNRYLILYHCKCCRVIKDFGGTKTASARTHWELAFVKHSRRKCLQNCIINRETWLK